MYCTDLEKAQQELLTFFLAPVHDSSCINLGKFHKFIVAIFSFPHRVLSRSVDSLQSTVSISENSRRKFLKKFFFIKKKITNDMFFTENFLKDS